MKNMMMGNSHLKTIISNLIEHKQCMNNQANL